MHNLNEILTCFDAQRLEYLAKYKDTDLYQALCYATDGGKRIRASLCYGSVMLHRQHSAKIDFSPVVHRLALSVEFMHAYSLVHDDLPSIDNDELRRGKPTVHKAFGEDKAILIGDLLQNLSIEAISTLQTNNHKAVLDAINFLLSASGIKGMIGGQWIDIKNNTLSEHDLISMHNLKTGKLIHFAILAHCLFPEFYSDNAAEIKTKLEIFANNLGLAFQVRDDYLDAIGDNIKLAKNTKQDARNHKTTFVDLLGTQQSKEYAMHLLNQAELAICDFPNNEILISIIDKLKI